MKKVNCEKVFFYFNELSRIPRGSGNTSAVSDYCARFARERGLEVIRDEYGNVIIKKDASLGYENAPVTILQGHLDMVCIAEEGREADFEKEPISVITDGGFLTADGTTLGADNGIAVAMILTILDSSDLPHPPLEAVLTTDEEVGLIGASNLDVSALRGRRLINMDSEEEGVITVSCAGGLRALARLSLTRGSFDGDCVKISVTGLRGGHSGIDINRGRANANKLIAAILKALSEKYDIRLADISGGLRDNAIPAQASAIVSIKGGDIHSVIEEETERIKERYADTEDGVRIELEAAEPCETFDKHSTDAAVSLIYESPDGVTAMSKDITGPVQTSLNLGTVRVCDGALEAAYSLRSSVNSEKAELCGRLFRIAEKYGGSVSTSGEYGAWEYRSVSPLRELATEVFADMYGKEPETAAIHAGLECGIFADKIEGLDAISIGPEILDVHTPDERLDIASAKRVYAYILEILKRTK